MTHDERLKHYKELIDQDIAEYSKSLLADTENEYGKYSKETVQAFIGILARGGKRLRGALVMASYEMLGGTNQQMIIQAARAIEMIHAYVLMIDDIADRSESRRGGPSGHKIMQAYHQTEGLKGDSAHFGESMSTQAALIGGYLAELVIDELDVPAEIKLHVLKNMHSNLVHTGHGQLRDILNETLPHVTEDDAVWTATYKTAYYTVINPLETGAILAGGTDKDIEILRQFGMPAGIGFQIADDILGIFGESDITGKSSLDDLREGKITVLMTHTLAQATAQQRRILLAALGNLHLTEDEARICRQIIQEVGALEYAQQKALDLASHAQDALGAIPPMWQSDPVDFLRYLTEKFVRRTV